VGGRWLPLNFLPGDPLRVVYEGRRGSVPRFIEFSYASLSRPMFCARGIVALTSSAECPLAHECPHYRPLGESCRWLASGSPLTYPELYEVRAALEAWGVYEEGRALLCLTIDGLPLLKACEARVAEGIVHVSRVTLVNRLYPIGLAFTLKLRQGLGRLLGGETGLLLRFYREGLRAAAETALDSPEAVRCAEYSCDLYRRWRSKGGLHVLRLIASDLARLRLGLRVTHRRVSGAALLEFCEECLARSAAHGLLIHLCAVSLTDARDLCHAVTVGSDAIDVLVLGRGVDRMAEILRAQGLTAIRGAAELLMGRRLRREPSGAQAARASELVRRFESERGREPHPASLYAHLLSELRGASLSKDMVCEVAERAVRGTCAEPHYALVLDNCPLDPVAQWVVMPHRLVAALGKGLAAAAEGVACARSARGAQLLRRALRVASRRLIAATSSVSARVVREFLEPAAKRGIQVEVLSGRIAGELIAGAVELRELSFRGPWRGTVLIVDGALAYIAPWSMTVSDLRERSTTLVIQGPEGVGALRSHLALGE